MSFGLQLNSIHLKDALLFKDVEYKFEKGITAIYGLNKTNASKSKNGNGAGKSAFFSQPGEILYELPIVGQRQDTLKTGMRKLDMHVQGRHLMVRRKGSKLELKHDGKLKKFRKKPDGRKWLASMLPINQEEYNTYVHLDARVPHPLVMGTSTERKRFFTSFFGLDKFDTERKLFTAELAKLSKIRSAYNELKAEYSKVRDQLIPEDELKAMKAKVRGYKETLDDLNQKNTKLQVIAQLLNFEFTAQPQLKALTKFYDEKITVDGFDELIETTKKNYADDKAKLADAKEWEQYQRDTRHYDKALAALSDDAKKLIAKLGLKEARRKCGGSADNAMHLRVSIMNAEHRIKANKKVVAEGRPEVVEAPEKDRKELRARLDSLEHQYDHAKQFKAGTCETCGQSVKAKDPAELKVTIKKVKAQLAQFEAYEEYKLNLAAYKKAKEELAEDREDLAGYEKEHTKLERYARLMEELIEIPRKPAKFEGRKLEAQVMQKMVDEDKERLTLLEFLRPNLETLIGLQGLTDKQRASGPLAARLQIKINEVHEKRSKLKARLGTNEGLTENAERMRARLREMKASLVDEEALKLLIEGYSDKQVKRMAVKAISSRLMTEVNKYARFVFSENFTFEFAWDTSQMSLLVHRKYGKKVRTSDVRKLSGAESKLFTIVLVLALLTFVPPRKRCNTIFLDEPTANMSEETTAAFKALLPIINQVIPNIVVITPKSAERYEGATEWTMVKQGGETTMYQGHPSTFKGKK